VRVDSNTNNPAREYQEPEATSDFQQLLRVAYDNDLSIKDIIAAIKSGQRRRSKISLAEFVVQITSFTTWTAF